MAGPRVEGTGDLNSRRAQLRFVTSYLLCNLGELLTLSETQFLLHADNIYPTVVGRVK